MNTTDLEQRLRELAERCEAAEAGSFALDKEILAALGYTWRGMDYWYRDDSHTWPGMAALTRSLDAAMTLVPEECRFNLNKRPYAEGRQDGYHAQVWFSRYYETAADIPNAWAATPALALCAAALRARAALKGPSHE